MRPVLLTPLFDGVEQLASVRFREVGQQEADKVIAGVCIARLSGFCREGKSALAPQALNQTGVSQLIQSLFGRDATDPELTGEFVFRRQALTLREPAFVEFFEQVVDDLLEEGCHGNGIVTTADGAEGVRSDKSENGFMRVPPDSPAQLNRTN